MLSQTSAKKINAGSRIKGVEIVIILPYSLRGIPGDPDAEQLLSYVKELGISYVEMQAPPAERFAGISADNPVEWRLSAGMEKFKEIGRASCRERGENSEGAGAVNKKNKEAERSGNE